VFGFGEVERTSDEVVLAYSFEVTKQNPVSLPVSRIF
jgi:hypothetical protein